MIFKTFFVDFVVHGLGGFKFLFKISDNLNEFSTIAIFAFNELDGFFAWAFFAIALGKDVKDFVDYYYTDSF